MRTFIGTTFYLLASVFALLAPASAVAATTTMTVPAEYKLHSGHPPGSLSSCANNMFARWKHVAGTTNARVLMGTQADPDAKVTTGTTPFDNHYVISASSNWTVDVEHGYDWLHVGKNGSFSFNPDAVVDCTDNATKLTTFFGEKYPVATVELTVNVPDARFLGYKGIARLDRFGRAPIARVHCPKGASCKIIAPKFAPVTIAGKRYSIRVIAPRQVGSGKTSAIRIQVPAPIRSKFSTKRATRVAVKLGAIRMGSKVESTRTRFVKR